MAIKHELDPTSPDTAPPSTPKKQKKPATANTPATPSPAKSGWTPESRETLIERLLTIGWQYAKLDDLVQEVRCPYAAKGHKCSSNNRPDSPRSSSAMRCAKGGTTCERRSSSSRRLRLPLGPLIVMPETDDADSRQEHQEVDDSIPDSAYIFGDMHCMMRRLTRTSRALLQRDPARRRSGVIGSFARRGAQARPPLTLF